MGAPYSICASAITKIPSFIFYKVNIQQFELDTEIGNLKTIND